jgi:hypothetical protein
MRFVRHLSVRRLVRFASLSSRNTLALPNFAVRSFSVSSSNAVGQMQNHNQESNAEDNDYQPIDAPIGQGHVVEFVLKTSLVDGTMIQEEDIESPSLIKIGSPYVVTKLDSAMRGLQAGDSFSVELTPEDRGVDYMDELVVKFPVPKGYLEENNVEVGDWMEYPVDKLFEYMMGNAASESEKKIIDSLKQMSNEQEEATITGQVLKLYTKKKSMDLIKVDFNVPYGKETFRMEGRVLNNYGEIDVDVDEQFQNVETQNAQMMEKTFNEKFDDLISDEKLESLMKESNLSEKDYVLTEEDRQSLDLFMKEMEKLKKRKKAKKMRSRAAAAAAGKDSSN